MKSTNITAGEAEDRLDPKERKRMIDLLSATPQEDIDTSEIRVLPPDKWAKAAPFGSFRPVKKPVNLRIDADILAWFQSLGTGYQTRMNNALREHMERKTG